MPKSKEFEQYLFHLHVPVGTFSKGKLYPNPKMMKLPDKKAGDDFNSLDAINSSVLKTHLIKWEGHSVASASLCITLFCPHSIPLRWCCYCFLTKEEPGAQKGEAISSRSNGTFEAEVELKLRSSSCLSRKRKAYHSLTAALGCWEIRRAGPKVCCPGVWGQRGVGDIQTEPDVLSVSRVPSQQAETLKKRLPWQLAFLME